MTTTFQEFQDDGITHTKMLKQRQNEYHFLGARVEEYHKLRGLQRSRQWIVQLLAGGHLSFSKCLSSLGFNAKLHLLVFCCFVGTVNIC